MGKQAEWKQALPGSWEQLQQKAKTNKKFILFFLSCSSSFTLIHDHPHHNPCVRKKQTNEQITNKHKKPLAKPKQELTTTETHQLYSKKVELAPKLGLEWTCAVSSALLVAPFISIIDKAIFSNASGRQKLTASLAEGFKTMAVKPAYFFRQPSFLLIWGVYSGTCEY
jgi:hypothetical protein